MIISAIICIVLATIRGVSDCYIDNNLVGAANCLFAASFTYFGIMQSKELIRKKNVIGAMTTMFGAGAVCMYALVNAINWFFV